jgi:olfactory receptor
MISFSLSHLHSPSAAQSDAIKAFLQIAHFCELAHFLKLACSDVLIDNILIYVEACMLGDASLLGILLSYIHIMSSVLKMPSLPGNYKAFSTCGSHFSLGYLFHMVVVGVYISLVVTNSPTLKDKRSSQVQGL